jgi:hypothetical protein
LLIKIVNFGRKEPRRPSDLRRLLRYLFLPKLSVNISADRLLGPPELHHLLLCVRPWNMEATDAAEDITDQFVRYCRESTSGRDMPDVWYVHFIFSFAPTTTPKLTFPSDTHLLPQRGASTSKNAIRIAKDALDAFGWSDTQPSIFVVHGDRAHVHVHAVIAIPVFGGTNWDVLKISRQQLHEYGQICAEAFSLPTSMNVNSHFRKWEDLID